MSARARQRTALVVGSGPNGLAGALVLAKAGYAVRVVERNTTVGGGARTLPLTLPGFLHDPCSAIHPLAAGSPYLRTEPLEAHGLSWVQPPAPLAHPLDDGSAVLLERSVDATAAGLGADGPAWRRHVGAVARDWPLLEDALLGPPLRPPRSPLALAAFGARAVVPARRLAADLFRGERARALFAGMAAHSMLPLERPLTSATGLVLGALGHVVGWPLPRGGAQRISDAMAALLRERGGAVEVGREVQSLDDEGTHDVTLLDLSPRGAMRVAGARFPVAYRRRLRAFRHGAGAFKLDYALDGPIPWRAAECARAGTVHLGGTLAEMAAAEAAPWRGRVARRPFVLLAQPTLFDPSRAPPGRHVAWAYAHVPAGWTGDATAAIEAQIERFAPGFRDRVLARHAMGPAALERYDPNYVGGDINGGVLDVRQAVARPVFSSRPYATPARGVYLCSASTPPGGGVHGMCGWHAARAALSGAGDGPGPDGDGRSDPGPGR
jgi:phytoene dehydrogenase-like protein